MRLSFIGRICVIIIFIFNLSYSISFGQERPHPLNRSGNRELLNYHEIQANEFANKNFNKIALDHLKSYDHLLDSLYKKEKEDTLATLENIFQSGNSERKPKLEGLQNQISELTKQKDDLEHRYSSFLKKSVLSFIIWLAIVILLLQIRRRKMKKAKGMVENANTQLQSLEESSTRFVNYLNDVKKQSEVFKNVSVETNKLNSKITSLADQNNVPPVWPVLLTKIEKLKKLIDSEDKIINAVIAQSEAPNEEIINTDINTLCESYLEIAYRGVQNSESFNCEVGKDFEKRLPLIKINPAAVGSLILNIVNNAFHSVKEKSNKGIKGYAPKITVSTRILPKFLQIRIRDNGTGMNEQELQSAQEEFYTTRSLNEGCGLGLNIAKNIISEIHKGEIKIESEPGASTDVYIKFYI